MIMNYFRKDINDGRIDIELTVCHAHESPSSHIGALLPEIGRRFIRNKAGIETVPAHGGLQSDMMKGRCEREDFEADLIQA